MKKFSMLVFLLVYSFTTSAKWSNPSSLEECSDYPGYEGYCVERYYVNEYHEMKEFMRQLIQYQLSGIERKYNEEICDDEKLIDNLTQLFDEREKTWNDYVYRKCKLETYGSRGRGDRHTDDCMREMKAKRRELLGRNIKTGIGSQECTTSGSVRLVTENFIVDLTNNCDFGLYQCDSIQYHGLRKSDKSTITLKGKFKVINDNGSRNFAFMFVNGNVEYLVSLSGHLTVKNKTTKKLMVSESGLWERGVWRH
jgi:hypothetical protein